MEPEGQIPIQQFIDLCDQCLKKGCDSDGVIDASRNIADAKFQCWEKRVWTHVPIDLPTIIDAAGFDKKGDVTLKRTVRLELIGNTRAGEPRKKLRSDVSSSNWLI